MRLEVGALSDVTNERYYEDGFDDTTFTGRRLAGSPEYRNAGLFALDWATAGPVGSRLRLRQEAELQRQGLLRLAGEIRQWRERVEKARGAGASDLAGRAEAHIVTLMEQGRSRWQTLGEVGERFAAVERDLQQLTARAAPAQAPGQGGQGATGDGGREKRGQDSAKASPMEELEQAWASFETEQELESLRRRQG